MSTEYIATEPYSTGRGRTFDGKPLQPGVNVDHVNVAAGLKELRACGYDHPNTAMVIEYALMRWKRGEEQQAERGAIDRNFHGIDFTSWRRVLAAAIAVGTQEAADGNR